MTQKSAMPMNQRDSSFPRAAYHRLSVMLHWLMALLIIATLGFGLYMVELPFSPARIKQFNWHKWAGISILCLAALRLLWRLKHPPTALSIKMPVWQVRAASLTHLLLYVCFFGVPLLGWAYSSAAGFPVVWFGVLPLPDWVAPNPELAKTLKLLHRSAAYALAGFIVLHILAALKHHWIDKDALMSRMSWR
jgi:cytochrome b561